MFKQSRRKIVAAILSVLVLLLFGTFCTIYLASYADMTSENREMLEIFVEAYSLPGEPGADPGAYAGRANPAASRRCWSCRRSTPSRWTGTARCSRWIRPTSPP